MDVNEELKFLFVKIQKKNFFWGGGLGQGGGVELVGGGSGLM